MSENIMTEGEQITTEKGDNELNTRQNMTTSASCLNTMMKASTSSSNIMCSLSNLNSDQTIEIGHLFGPFSDPLQWLAFKYKETKIENIERRIVDIFKRIDIAKNKDEQNMEIILKNGQFYFRSLIILNPSSVKLLAWFSDELSARLPMPLASTLNGIQRFYCGLCNQVFLQPNTVVVHILFNCSRRHEILPRSDNEIIANVSQPNSYTSIGVNEANKSQQATKKRGFDIDSLVNNDYHPENNNGTHSGKVNINSLSHHMEEIKGNKKQRNNSGISSSSNNNNTHNSLEWMKSAFQLPNLTATLLNEEPNRLNQLSLINSLSNLSSLTTNTQMPSAFRKVDKSNLSSNNGSITSSSSIIPYDFNALYSTRGLGLPASALFSQQFGYPSTFNNSLLSQSLSSSTISPLVSSSSTSSSSSTIPGHGIINHSLSINNANNNDLNEANRNVNFPNLSSANNSINNINAASNHPNSSINNNSSSSNNSRNENGSKNLIPASLLPFLPPSLAALSFPQSNWCAKCNATFRMTSDLVYHMRSHHKTSLTMDPLKKKREEKLRCSICGETFRERHHLTRHMTSHQ